MPTRSRDLPAGTSAHARSPSHDRLGILTATLVHVDEELQARDSPDDRIGAFSCL